VDRVALEGSGVTSELFLVQVVQVESLPVIGDDDFRTLLLLYHWRGYVTTSDMLDPPLDKPTS